MTESATAKPTALTTAAQVRSSLCTPPGGAVVVGAGPASTAAAIEA